MSGTSSTSNNIVIIEDKYVENRGNIYTTYDKRTAPKGLDFVQDKVSKSFQGVIRGFHGDNSTWKFISCLYGKIKLVTYNIDTGKKMSYTLDSEDVVNRSILVPPRTLNGHQCLSDTCVFHYKWSEYYIDAKRQWSVRYNDPDINPEWDSRFHPIVSDRDKSAQNLKELLANVNR